MPIFNPGTGFTGTPEISNWAAAQSAISAMREAAAGATLLIWPEAGQMGCFVDPLNGDGVVYEKLSDIATIARASKAWHPNWDFTNGGEFEQLIEFANDAPVMGPGGLLVSGQVENLVANPRFEGAALPALPTGYFESDSNNIMSFVGRGTQNGWPYLELLLHGTGSPFLRPGAVTAAAGDVIRAYIGVAHLGGTLVQPGLRINNQLVTPTAVNLTVDRKRRMFHASATMPSPTTQSSLEIRFPNATYVNAVYRIYAPQITKTAYPTPIVLPPAGTPGATVKQADVCTLPTNGWYRHTEGTVVVEMTQPPRRTDDPNGGSGIGLIRIENETEGEHRGLQFVDSTGQLQGFARQSGGGASANVGAPLAVGARALVALSWSAAGNRAALNGTVGALFGASEAVGAATKMRLGQGALTGTYPLIHSQAAIKQVRYFPRAMSEVELAAITAPYWS